ncbi:hypothetical protein OIDMADRAFT_61828 [Oidiodendron maius Zn]|uniref:Uncharacterized protein n=1 Tax=Oidiodendron maius (strain Zn) TaxID=913774 RepID=A0A0C3GAG8_OIDMZ|nr:hypothetical protein OIDMADRAFT_61828 [Oidiodendron maius Zn]
MTKRTAEFALVRENYGENESSCKQIARSRTIKLLPPIYIASVKELAQIGTRAGTSAANVDNTIIPRIKKCLERANQASTAKAEAKEALHLASRLMGQHNASQAQVLAHEPPATQRQYAGQSVVSIKRLDGDRSKAVKHQSYIDGLCHAMEHFFDCKSYSTTNLFAIEMTFYGIAENTVAAAMSFKMAYNLVSEWARPQKGVGGKNSYCLGISDELSRMAKTEKATEEAEAKRAVRGVISAKNREEGTEIRPQLGHQAPLPESPNISMSPEPASDSLNIASNSPLPRYDASSIKWSDWVTEGSFGEGSGAEFAENASENSEDCIKPDLKVEDENRGNASGNPEEETVKPEQLVPETSFEIHSRPLSPTPSLIFSPPERDPAISSIISDLDMAWESRWASHMQLVIFRTTAAKIADDYVEDKGVKIHHQSARRTAIHNRAAYNQGVKDSKKIDVHKRRIEE